MFGLLMAELLRQAPFQSLTELKEFELPADIKEVSESKLALASTDLPFWRELRKLITVCLEPKPESRPTATELCKRLGVPEKPPAAGELTPCGVALKEAGLL